MGEREDRLDRASAIFERYGDPCPWARGGDSPDRPQEPALTLLIEEIRALRQRISQIENYLRPLEDN